MPRKANRHWLRENHVTRSPYRVLVIDTETVPDDPADEGAHRLRLWCARLIRRRGVDPELPRTEDFQGATASELAALVHRLARRDRTLWAFCHNLSFDLAVTALPVELAALGWKMTEGALTSDSPWFRMGRGECRLTMADSWSWLPASLESIGQLLREPKARMPAFGAPDEDWYAYCARDVVVTSLALTNIMDWWDANSLGNWSVTGPACGWSTYRHQRPAPRVLVDPVPEAMALEARAISGGRRDVRRIGVLPGGLYADLDVSTAHLTVMGNKPLPARRFGAFERLDPSDYRLRSGSFDVLAEATVRTTQARYPWNSGAGVFYPVGTFTTVLAGPELREAHRRGELLAIGRGYTYHMRPHMLPWALWLARLLDRSTPDVPDAVRLMAKHWSRCVPGKWGSHTSEVISRTPDPRPGWAVERGFIARTRQPADFLRLGGELWTIARDEWADDAFPAILAFIQSHTRVAIGRLLDQLEGSWLTVNTDGAMVDVVAWWRGQHPEHAGRLPRGQQMIAELDAWLDSANLELDPFVVRVKGAWSQLTVWGPQHLIPGTERRLAGIPRKAVALGGGRFRFTAWPKLRVQLVPDGPPRFRTQERTVTLAHIPPNGWLGQDGRVWPVELADEAGRATILGPEAQLAAAHGGLADVERQHAKLRPVLRTLQYGENGEPAQDAPGPAPAAPVGLSTTNRRQRPQRPARPPIRATAADPPPPVAA